MLDNKLGSRPPPSASGAAVVVPNHHLAFIGAVNNGEHFFFFFFFVLLLRERKKKRKSQLSAQGQSRTYAHAVHMRSPHLGAYRHLCICAIDTYIYVL